MRRRELLALPLGSVLGLAPVAEARAAGRRRAWVGAELWSPSAGVLRDATIVVEGERIVSIGRGGPVDGADVVDLEGSIVTPGFVATESPLGLVEVSLEPSTVDSTVPDAGRLALFAAHSAADGYNSLSTLIAVARRGGVTSAVATPEGGLVSGTSAWADLVDRFAATAIRQEDLALHADLREAETRPFALSRLRNALESARLYARSPRDYDLGRTRALALGPLELARLSQLLGGALPLVVRVSRAADIVRLLSLSESYGLRLVLSGAEEAWMVAPRLAATRVPVILDPTQNLPNQFGSLGSRLDAAQRLHEAGVRVVFSAFDAHRAHTLRQLAGNAVAQGLGRAAALAALTSEPADAFGMSSRHGDVTPGKLANFCVWTGDPFELDTWTKAVIIHGRDARLRTRQDELFERYRDLDAIPHGTPSD